MNKQTENSLIDTDIEADPQLISVKIDDYEEYQVVKLSPGGSFAWFALFASVQTMQNLAKLILD